MFSATRGERIRAPACTFTQWKTAKTKETCDYTGELAETTRLFAGVVLSRIAQRHAFRQRTVRPFDELWSLVAALVDASVPPKPGKYEKDVVWCGGRERCPTASYWASKVECVCLCTFYLLNKWKVYVTLSWNWRAGDTQALKCFRAHLPRKVFRLVSEFLHNVGSFPARLRLITPNKMTRRTFTLAVFR